MVSRREQTLKTLHDAATEIQDCDSVTGACQQTVDAAEAVLDYEMCTIMVHEDGLLEPVVTSSGSPDDAVRPMHDDQGFAGKTVQTQESYVVEQIEAEDGSEPALECFESGISVPIGEFGVFQAVAKEPRAFDPADVEFTELLVAHTAGAIDRLQFREELQAQKEALERQNDRLEKFIHVVSHDLRNPLSVATGQLELAKAERDWERLDTVERAHDRMGVLIDELLALARKGQPVNDPEAVNLGVLCDGCWQNVVTGEATLATETDQTIRADPGRLKRLLENLFRNAIEHGSGLPPTHARRAPVQPDSSDEHSAESLIVTVGDLPDGFYVSDNGPGIPEDERDAVFEAGYTTTSEGTGLGLNIVKEIANAHGWSVELTETNSRGCSSNASDAPDHDRKTGCGARFEITGVEIL